LNEREGAPAAHDQGQLRGQQALAETILEALVTGRHGPDPVAGEVVGDLDGDLGGAILTHLHRGGEVGQRIEVRTHGDDGRQLLVGLLVREHVVLALSNEARAPRIPPFHLLLSLLLHRHARILFAPLPGIFGRRACSLAFLHVREPGPAGYGGTSNVCEVNSGCSNLRMERSVV